MCQTMRDFYDLDQIIELKNGNKGKIIEVFGQNNNDIRPIIMKHGYFTIKLDTPDLGTLRVIPANAEILYNNEITVLDLL